MISHKSRRGHDSIHAALNKLRNESNAKELELIELVASVYESVKEKQDQLTEKVQDTANTVNTSVHLHPWYYIGGAAVCGILTGFFLRR